MFSCVLVSWHRGLPWDMCCLPADVTWGPARGCLANPRRYACAYTTQLCVIDPHQGRAWPAPAEGWDNGEAVGKAESGGAPASLLVDGAKRDRTIWYFGKKTCGRGVAHRFSGAFLPQRTKRSACYSIVVTRHSCWHYS